MDRRVKVAGGVQEGRGGAAGEAIARGVHPRTLYGMRDSGMVEAVARGVYRLGEMEPLTHPDLVAVAKKVSGGVICLTSALAFHELTTQVPHEVYVAIGRTMRVPRMSYPPLRVFYFSKGPFEWGVERHEVDGVGVRIYSEEKTIADCFKYRNKIGMEIVLEALRAYRRKQPRLQKLLESARVCRVERVMRAYLEALE